MNESEHEKNFCIPGSESPRNRVREITIRFAGITIISLVSIFLDSAYAHSQAGMFKTFLVSFVRTALIWNGSMLIIEYAIGRYSMFKETFKLIVFQVTGLVMLVVLVEVCEIYIVENYLQSPLNKSDKTTLIVGSLLITFMISAIYASTAFFIQWKENLLRSQALEKANLEAKYDTLRNQVNPHFLFNSLNTLLALVENNAVATKYVESISEIMRYMLQTRDKEVVLLRDELTIAKEYLFIQQNRFGDKLTVEFDIPEQYFHYAIPPLALQMLLENVLKHNVCSTEHPLHVKIFIVDKQYVAIENNTRSKMDKEPSTGVGLENIRNRYLYLSGKDIVVKSGNGRFIVMLPLFEKSLS